MDVATQIVRMAKEHGLAPTGPYGLLKQLTKSLIEAALNEEMTDHLGYEKHDPAGSESMDIRNRTRGKAVLMDSVGISKLGFLGIALGHV